MMKWSFDYLASVEDKRLFSVQQANCENQVLVKKKVQEGVKISYLS